MINDQRVSELQDLVIWMTGCGYDFTKHPHFIKQRDKLVLLDEDKLSEMTTEYDGSRGYGSSGDRDSLCTNANPFFNDRPTKQENKDERN